MDKAIYLIDKSGPNIFSTILVALIIFIFSQFILKIFIEPIVSYKKVVGKIIGGIKFYSDVIFNPPIKGLAIPKDKWDTEYNSGVKHKEAKEFLRKLSAELEGAYNSMTCKGVLIFFKIIINYKNKDKISENLIYLSNITGQDVSSESLEKSKRIEKIKSILIRNY